MKVAGIASIQSHQRSQTRHTLARCCRVMTVLFVVLLCITPCSRGGESSAQPATPTESKDRTYRSLDGRCTIAIVSSDELEIRQDGQNIVCKYTDTNAKLRVLVSNSGTTKAKYYNITPKGLVGEQGEILYEPTTYKNTLTELDELKVQLKAGIESNNFKSIEDRYGKNGPPEELMKIAMQAVMTNAGVAQIVNGQRSNARAKSMDSACRNNLVHIAGTKDMYVLDHNGAAPTTMSDLVPAYIRVTPTCPAGGQYSIGTAANAPECSIHGKMP